MPKTKPPELGPETSALLAALEALRAAAVGAPVLLRGDPDPEGAESVLVVELVSSTSRTMYGAGASGETRVQVGCYAPSTAAALELASRARAALLAAGLHWIGSTPAPIDLARPDEYGLISDFSR